MGRMQFIIVMLAVAVAPATLFAGGGSKSNSHLRIRNNSNSVLAVVVDPPAGFDPQTRDDVTRIGGKFLNSGETADFRVKEGSHTVAAAYIDDDGPGTIGTTTVNSTRNRNIDIDVSGSVSSAPTFTRR